MVDEFCIQVRSYLQIKNMGGVVRGSTKTAIAPCLALQNSYRYNDMQAWHSKATVQSPNLSPFLYAGALSIVSLHILLGRYTVISYIYIISLSLLPVKICLNCQLDTT